MWIVIPAYEPGDTLPDLVRDLRDVGNVLVVDDGSGEDYLETFERAELLGARVLYLRENQGKAQALRTGMRWVMENYPGRTVVCADSDGQHRADDVAKVLAEVDRREANHAAQGIVLGARSFAGNVPFRSRFGNRATSALMEAVTGLKLGDTQTGLRGYPAALLPWLLHVKGERFAWELKVLIEASREGIPVVEVPIETVYIDDNSSSHFRPVIDSAKVLAPLGLFALSSLVAFAVDAVALLALNAITGSLLWSVIGARVISGSMNFSMNRTAVFRSKGPLWREAAKYVVLALTLLAASYGSLWLLTGLGVPLLAAKLLTDATLFVLSFVVQRVAVFGSAKLRWQRVFGHARADAGAEKVSSLV